MCTSSRVQKDLFQDIGSLDESDGDSLISLSMGAPGLAALDGCNDIMLEATKRTLVRLLIMGYLPANYR